MRRLHPVFVAVVLVAAVAIFVGIAPTAAEPQIDRYHPAIAGYGRIVPLPDAAIQPAAGHRVIFDVTAAASDPGAVNPGLDHVARYVNLLASAGVRPKNAPVVAVVHGDATEAVLDDSAYHIRHERKNPNAELIRALEAQGVKLYVCGQALAGENVDPKAVVDDVEVATSAITVLAAFQMRRYALVPQY